MEGFIALRTSSLDEFYFDTGMRRQQPEPQRGGRSILRSRKRPHHPEHGIGTVNSQMQTAQRFRADLRLPEQQRAATAVTQYLFSAP